MSILFEPIRVGNVELQNRFVHSATCEARATERGEATDGLVDRYRRLARGEVGLIITGFMYVHPMGQCYRHLTGIYSDELIPGLKRVTDAIHEEEGKVAFQLAHGGVNANTVGRIVEAGANVLVSGSALFGASGGFATPQEIAQAVRALRSAAGQKKKPVSG